MIYLITGVPGSGKTLYAVSTLVQKLMAEKIQNKDGSTLERRLVVDGIPGLLLPHVLMAERPSEGALSASNQKSDAIPSDAGDGLWNWPSWVQPGDILVIDEVQRFWRPRGMGTKPPLEIAALETHRHLGVDFVIITQNPMLIDQNVRRLVGRHQHVRRLFGMQRAIIYDWDACSMDVNRTKTATTTSFGYPKSAYKLYQSSVLHLKQRQKIPLWLIVPVLALVGGLAVAPKAFSTMQGAMTGKGVSGSVKPAPVASVPVAVASAPFAAVSAPVAAASLPASAASAPLFVASAPVVSVPAPVAGCVAVGKQCACFDASGVKSEVVLDVCFDRIRGMALPGQKVDLSAVPTFAENHAVSSSDNEVQDWMRKHR